VSKNKRKRAIQLSYLQTQCKCGAARIKGQPCPDCGQSPGKSEVDYKTLERRNSIQRLQDLHQSGCPVPEHGPAVDQPISGKLSELALEVPEAFRLAVMDGEPELLQGLIQDLAAYQTSIAQWPRIRPYVVKRKLSLEMVTAITDAVTYYFDACASATPLEAQRNAVLMQNALDAGSATRRLLIDAEEADDELDYQNMESFITSVLKSETQRIGLGLREVIQGQQRLVGLLGVEPADQLRFAFIIAAGAAEGMDKDEFKVTFNGGLEFFRLHADRLVQLAADPDFRAALDESDLVVANSLWQTHAAMEKAQSDTQAMNVLAGLISDLVEGPGALIARCDLLLHGIKQQSFAKLTEDNATTQIDRIAAVEDLKFLVAGIDTDLRVARSHNQLRIRDGVVTAVSRGKAKAYTTLELMDRVLHCLETVTAVTLALKQVLAEIGIEWLSTDLASVGLDKFALARIVIRELYGAGIEISLDGMTLLITIDDAPDLDPIPLVAATGPYLERAMSFEVTQSTTSGTRIVSGPTDLIKEPLPVSDLDRTLVMLRIMSACRINDEPYAGTTENRRVILGVAIPILRQQELTLDDGRVLRKLISHAQLMGDPPLEAALRQSMRRVSGEPLSAEVIEQFVRLMER
jgi:hypothetical protein